MGSTYSKVQEKVAEGMVDVGVGLVVAGIDVGTGSVTEGLLAQAASVLFEELSCLVVRSRRLSVPVDHDKLQSIVKLSSEKPDQALISFRAFI